MKSDKHIFIKDVLLSLKDDPEKLIKYAEKEIKEWQAFIKQVKKRNKKI